MRVSKKNEIQFESDEQKHNSSIGFGSILINDPKTTKHLPETKKRGDNYILVYKIVGNDEKGNGGESFDKATYACRPPGVYHGPFKSEKGCTLFELHYYKNDEEF